VHNKHADKKQRCPHCALNSATEESKFQCAYCSYKAFYRLRQTGEDDPAAVIEQADKVVDLDKKNEATIALRNLGWCDTRTLSTMFMTEYKAMKTSTFLQQTFKVLAHILTTLAGEYSAQRSSEHPIVFVLLCAQGVERSLVLLNVIGIRLSNLEVAAVARNNDLGTKIIFTGEGESKRIKNPIIPTMIEQLPNTFLRLVLLNISFL
jgi:DNA-directed RNA polymerase subunit RPC12/RpoP